MSDVTEIFQAEKRWQFALEGADEGVWDWNLQTNHVFFSRHWKSMLGYDDNEISDSLDEWSLRVHPDDLPAVMQEIEKYLRGETPVYISEHRVRCKDGSYKWVLDSGKVMEWTVEKKPLRMIGTHKDITERRKSEENLRESEERFSRVFKSNPAAQLIVNMENGLILDANDSFCSQTGFSYNELIGHTTQELNLWQKQDEQRRIIGQLKDGSPIQVDELNLYTKSGEVRTQLFSFEPVEIKGIKCVISTSVDITTRKQAEEKLRKNEALLQEAQRIGHIGHLEWTAPNKHIICSEELYRIFELPQDGKPVSQHTIEAMLSPEDRQRLYEADRHAFSHRLNLDYEYQVTLTSGRSRWIHHQTNVTYDENGQPIRMLGIVQDITERKQAEEKLVLAESRYRALIENAPDGIVLIRLDENGNGRIKYASPSLYRTFGYSFEDIDDIDPAGLTHPEDLEQVIAVLVDLLQHPTQTPTIQYRFRSKDGRWLWIESTFSNLLSLPSLEAIVINFRDIHERKLSEEALRESNEIARAILNTSTDSVFLMEPDGNIIAANETTAVRLGKKVSDLIGHNIYDFIPGHVSEERKKKINSIVLSQIPAVFEDERFGVWLENSIYPIIEPNGTIKRLAIFGRDITERKHAELALQEGRLRMERALKGANSATWDWNVKTGETVFNERWAEIVGYSLQELQPVSIQTWADFCHPEDLIISNSLLEKHFAGETEYYECEARMKHKNGSWVWVIDQGKVMEWAPDGTPIRMFGTHLDINERKREERYTQARLKLANLSYENMDMEALMQTMLDEAEALTESEIGFFHFVDNDQNTIHLQTWSTKTLETFCKAQGNGEHYPVKQAGVWADGIRNGKAHIYNDYANLPNRRNLPEGHASVIRLISLPIKRNNAVVAAVGVGNKPTDYNEHDLDILSRLSEAVFDIILRKKVEEALRRNEAHFRTVADFTYDMEYWQDEKKELLYMSPSCKRITGYTREDFLNDPAMLYEMVHPEDREKYKKHTEEDFETKESCSLDFRITTLDGNVIWVNHTCQMVKDEDGILRGRRASNRDITARKQASEELRASEEKYRGLLKSLDSVVATVDRDGKFLYMNDTASQQLGSTPEKLIGKTMYELFPEQVARSQMTDILTVIEANEGKAFQNTSYVKGQPRWYRTSIQPLHDGTGRVASVMINSTDIHELKSTQEELQDLNRTLEERIKERTAQVQDLYDNAPVGYHSINERREFISINQTELNMLGYTREELIGQRTSMVFAQESEIKLADQFKIFMKTGETLDLEVMAKRKDGTTFPVMINALAIYDENGNYVSSRSTMTDISLRKAAEDALRQSRDQLSNSNTALMKASQAKNEFLANMSHELRTPLNGILGMSEMLLGEYRGPLNERQRGMVNVIDSSGHHLLSLINDILDLSKIEAGKLEMHMEQVNIADICHASIAFIKEPAIKNGLTFDFIPDPAVRTVLADTRRLKQILVNLLSNSVKFTPEKGRITLEVKSDEQQHCIDFSVIDTGIGIAPDDLTRLFRPFTQVDSSLTREHEGTGLGLALVKELAELHGGGIRVTSEVGKGSTFTISLPWQDDLISQEKLSVTIKNTSQKVDLGTKRHGKILLAEDIETNIMIIGDYLEHLGYSMIYAANGSEALEKTREYLPDLILMDIQMPVMDGLDATRQIRLDPRFAALPIIALTAMAMAGDRERCLEAGATDYISKPVKLKELGEMVQNLLSSK